MPAEPERPSATDDSSTSPSGIPELPNAKRERMREVGGALARAAAGLLEVVPGRPERPSRLAPLLGTNRQVAAKLLALAASKDPFEVLHLSPGPEPLRKFADLAREELRADEVALDLERAADAFAELIREEAGTRPALDALVSAELPQLRAQQEIANRYAVHKGLSQLIGAEAELWYGLSIWRRSAEDPSRLDGIWVNVARGLRRLRPGARVRFSYANVRVDAQGVAHTDGTESLDGAVLWFDQLCDRPPARFDVRREGELIHYSLPAHLLGPRQAVDVIVADVHLAAVLRTPENPAHPLLGLTIDPAVPAAKLVFDVLIHEDVDLDVTPEFLAYSTGLAAAANPNDRSRDADRVDMTERVEDLGRDATGFRSEDDPRYPELLRAVAARVGLDLTGLRGHRVTVPYPVHGWQYTMTFDRLAEG